MIKELPIYFDQMDRTSSPLGAEEFPEISITNKSINFTLRPIFDDEEIISIKTQWDEERQQPEQRVNPTTLPSEAWNNDTARGVIKWFFEDHLMFEKDDPYKFREKLLSVPIHKALTKKSIATNIREHVPTTNLTQIVIDTYPELKIHPWEFKWVNWHGEEGIKNIKGAIRWMVEERYGYSPDHPEFRTVVTSLHAKHLRVCGLSGLLKAVGKHSKAIILSYEELELDESEFSRWRQWNGENGVADAIQCTKDLIENTLGFNPNGADFREKLRSTNSATFGQYGLNSMVQMLNMDYRQLVNLAYPDVNIHSWEFYKTPRGFWENNNYENVCKAIRWLVEEKLGLSPDEPEFSVQLKTKVMKKRVKEYGLARIYNSTGLSHFQILSMTYPESMRNQKKEEISKPSINSEKANQILDSFIE